MKNVPATGKNIHKILGWEGVWLLKETESRTAWLELRDPAGRGER